MAFKSVANLAEVRFDHTCGLFNSRLVVAGGFATLGASGAPNTTATANCEKTVLPNGGGGSSIGGSGQGPVVSTPVFAPPLTTARGNLRSVQYKNFWYVAGGDTTGGATQLSYVSGTGAFTTTDVVTGAVSGATGTIAAKSGSTATGTLTLTSATGTFVPGEEITDTATGVASTAGNQVLAYNTGTGVFTVGLVVTGGTSAATGIITAKSGSTATGTLTLKTVTGTFQAAETITDSSTGSAAATAAQTYTGSGNQVVGGITGEFLMGRMAGNADIPKWITLGMPVNLTQYQMWVWRNWIYIAGGVLTSTASNLNVYRAEINSDGTLGKWATVGQLPVAVTYKTNVTVAPREGNIVLMLVGSAIYSFTLGGDGFLGKPIKTTMSTTITGAAVFARNKVLYAIGGTVGGTVQSTQYIRLNQFGVPQGSVWLQGSALVTPRTDHSVVVDGDHVWVIGGLNASSAPLQSIEFDVIPGSGAL